MPPIPVTLNTMRVVSATVLALLTAVACASATPASQDALPSASTAGSTPTSAPVTLRTLRFPLEPARSRTERGMVTIEVQADGYVLSAAMSGLVPDQRRYLLNIHAGTCADENTDVIINVGQFDSDGAGSGTFTERYPGTKYVVATGGRILTLHGPFNSDDARLHIACANLSN